MNKQRLASLIWKYCEQVRQSGIVTSEYKDFILGFIFYKFLSDNLTDYLMVDLKYPKEILKDKLNEQNDKLVNDLKVMKGYFIEYNNLFSTWIKEIEDLQFSRISDAFNAFDRHIGKDYQGVYKNIFTSLNNNFHKLGDDHTKRIKHIKKILGLINDVPTIKVNNNYDVLGYVYEFLLGKFNMEAEKGGEFYTPYEISVIMSDVASYYFRNKDSIRVYDPTSGSGSLLINIGQSIKKYLNSDINIEYYAQEIVESTYNLTRMNLLMKGIKPQNIKVKNGDTLDADWPFEGNKAVQVDCVVANPPLFVKLKSEWSWIWS